MPETQNPATGDPPAGTSTTGQQPPAGGAGGNGQPATGTGTGQGNGGAGTGSGEGEPLGAAGLEALRSERSARQTAETALATARTQLEQATSAQERAVAQARVDTRQEVLGEADERLIRAEVIAAAVGKLRNPRLAPNLISLEGLEVKKGEVDTKEIDKRLDKLLEDEDYLRAAGQRPRTGSGDGGARGAPTPDSMDSRIRRMAGRGDE